MPSYLYSSLVAEFVEKCTASISLESKEIDHAPLAYAIISFFLAPAKLPHSAITGKSFVNRYLCPSAAAAKVPSPG